MGVTEDIDEEFIVSMDSNEKKFKSEPSQELTKEYFIQQSISYSFESNTYSNTIIGNLLEIETTDTT